MCAHSHQSYDPFQQSRSLEPPPITRSMMPPLHRVRLSPREIPPPIRYPLPREIPLSELTLAVALVSSPTSPCRLLFLPVAPTPRSAMTPHLRAHVRRRLLVSWLRLELVDPLPLRARMRRLALPMGTLADTGRSNGDCAWSAGKPGAEAPGTGRPYPHLPRQAWGSPSLPHRHPRVPRSCRRLCDTETLPG